MVQCLILAGNPDDIMRRSDVVVISLAHPASWPNIEKVIIVQCPILICNPDGILRKSDISFAHADIWNRTNWYLSLNIDLKNTYFTT